MCLQLTAMVDATLRRRIRAHHTATHLLQSALKRVLGPDTCQQGSLVDTSRLRYGDCYKPIHYCVKDMLDNCRCRQTVYHVHPQQGQSTLLVQPVVIYLIGWVTHIDRRPTYVATCYAMALPCVLSSNSLAQHFLCGTNEFILNL